MQKHSPVMVIILIGMYLLPTPLGRADQKAIAVIVNKKSEVEDLSMEELARIYKGRKERWRGGRRIIVIDRPIDSSIRRSFYRIVLDNEPTQQFFRVGSVLPFKAMTQASAITVKKFVASSLHTISYIYADELDDQVRALRINHVAPTAENIQSGRYGLVEQSVEKAESI